MKSLLAFVSVVVMASVAGASARAACPPGTDDPACTASGDNFGPATASRPVLTSDPDSDTLNRRITAHNEAIDAENQAAQARYQAQLAAYEDEKRAQASAYAAQLAEHDAKVAADKAAWAAHRLNCAAGDNSRCDASR
jgi:hypothetical protein